MVPVGLAGVELSDSIAQRMVDLVRSHDWFVFRSDVKDDCEIAGRSYCSGQLCRLGGNLFPSVPVIFDLLSSPDAVITL
jgi:hypothetical protein